MHNIIKAQQIKLPTNAIMKKLNIKYHLAMYQLQTYTINKN